MSKQEKKNSEGRKEKERNEETMEKMNKKVICEVLRNREINNESRGKKMTKGRRENERKEGKVRKRNERRRKGGTHRNKKETMEKT